MTPDVRLYRALLHILWPRRLRRSHGERTVELFAEMARDARARGRVELLRLWGRSLTGVVSTALRARLDTPAGPALRSLSPRSPLPLPGTDLMKGLRQDLLIGTRQLSKNPVGSLVMVLTLALGIGATTAVFSVVQGVLLEALPVRDPGTLALVTMDNPEADIEGWALSYPNYRDLRETSRELARLAAYSNITANVMGSEGPVRVDGALLSAGFLDVLGIEPFLGREFLPEEDRPGGPAVALIGYELWQRQLQGDPGSVGRDLLIDGEPRTVVGVLPPGQEFMDRLLQLDPERIPRPAQVFLPVAPVGHEQRRETSAFGVIARLAPDASFATADAELKAFLERMQQRHERMCCGWIGQVRPLREEIVGAVRPALLLALAAVSMVLLLVCVNLSALLTVRSTTRGREWAVRRALGAGRGRVVRQLLVESGVLGLLGGGAGLLLGAWLLGLLVRMAPADLPRVDEIGLDPGIVLASLAISLGATLAFGLAPALTGASRAPGEVLRVRQGGLGRGGARLLRGLVTVEVALALVLLSTSGLLATSFRNIAGQDPGYRIDDMLTGSVRLPRADYPGPAEVREFLDATLPALGALPGVEAAGSTSFPVPRGPWIGFEIEGQVDSRGRPASGSGQQMAVSPGTFRTLGMEAVAGRLLSEADGDDAAPVVVLSESLARRTWPQEDAVGQRIRVGSWREFDLGRGATTPLWHRVVGVVSDVRDTGIDGGDPIPYLYRSADQDPWQTVTFWLRAEQDAGSLAPALRETIQSVDPRLPLFDVEPVAATLARHRAREGFLAALVGGFALVALLLAAVGIYGVASYSVTLRTREIGVRVAVGASPGRLVRHLLAAGLLPAGLGASLGVALTALLAGSLRGLLHGVAATDPAVLAATACGLAAVAAVATWLPARRAARIDPTVALQEQ